jgi:hypothetical protein
MTTNEKVIKAAWQFYKSPPKWALNEAGWCLRLVRAVVERAEGLPDMGFYNKYVKQKADPPHDGFIARDAEKSLRALGYAIKPDQVMPGDLVFKFDVKYNSDFWVGHVGIIIAQGVVLENARPEWRNGGLFDNKGNVLLSDFEQWPAVTTYIRLP